MAVATTARRAKSSALVSIKCGITWAPVIALLSCSKIRTLPTQPAEITALSHLVHTGSS
jgi:hypothetical protein